MGSCSCNSELLFNKINSLEERLTSKIDKLADELADFKSEFNGFKADFKDTKDKVGKLGKEIYGNGGVGLKAQVAIIVSLGMAAVSILSVISLFLKG